MLRGRMLMGESIAARDASGALVAAASVSVGDSDAITTGMVHPAPRGRGLGIQRWSSGAALRLRAFSLHDNLTAHDAAYVALAEALRCPLVTRDA
jgi:predicted nucleic acid-binding protein